VERPQRSEDDHAGPLVARQEPGELLMTAPHARQPEVLPRPACTPTAIRAVLAANGDGDTLQRYDEDLDAAFEQADEQGDVTPLVQTVMDAVVIVDPVQYQRPCTRLMTSCLWSRSSGSAVSTSSFFRRRLPPARVRADRAGRR
jgi:hypothetical protein